MGVGFRILVETLIEIAMVAVVDVYKNSGKGAFMDDFVKRP